MPIERRPIVDVATWLAWRAPNVNCSDIPAVLGKNPYKTRMRLWAEKRGIEFDDKENDAMRRGRLFEPAVAKGASEARPDWTLVKGDSYFVDAELRIGGTPDYFIAHPARGRGLLQCKTANRDVYEREWGDGERCSQYAMFQNFSEVMLCGYDFGAVAVALVDGYKYDSVKVFDVPRHEEAWKTILAEVASFWREVDGGREPAPDYEVDGEVIRALAPRSVKAKTIDLRGNNTLPARLAQRAALRDQIAEMDLEVAAIENEVKHALGDAEVGIGIDGWSITYKTSSRAGYTVPPKENIRTLRINERPRT